MFVTSAREIGVSLLSWRWHTPSIRNMDNVFHPGDLRSGTTVNSPTFVYGYILMHLIDTVGLFELRILFPFSLKHWISLVTTELLCVKVI